MDGATIFDDFFWQSSSVTMPLYVARFIEYASAGTATFVYLLLRTHHRFPLFAALWVPQQAAPFLFV